MVKGKLVAFEGSHCAGKTTQIEGLGELAQTQSLPHHICREYKHPDWQAYSSAMFSSNPRIFAQDMYQHKREILTKIVEKNHVRERIDDGQTVIIDRYIQSLHAIYSYFGITQQTVKEDTAHFPSADITICLRVDPQVTISRAIRSNPTPNPFKTNEKYNQHLLNIFEEYKNNETLTLSGSLPRERLHKLIRSTIWPLTQFDRNYIPRALYKTYHKKRRL